jgi:hypothetical protein
MSVNNKTIIFFQCCLVKNEKNIYCNYLPDDLFCKKGRMGSAPDRFWFLVFRFSLLLL